MATAEFRDKRLAQTKKAISKTEAKRAKAQDDVKAADAELHRLKAVITWLSTMPVDDEVPPDDWKGQDADYAATQAVNDEAMAK